MPVDPNQLPVARPEDLGPVTPEDDLPAATPEELRPPPFKHGAENWWDQVNPAAQARSTLEMFKEGPIGVVYGASKAIGDSIESGVADIKAGKYAQGVAKILSAGSPLEKARGEVQKGDISGAVGTTLGVATNVLAPVLVEKAIPKIGQYIANKKAAAAQKLYEAAVKPTTLEPGLRENMIQSGLKEGAELTPEGIDVAKAAKARYGQQIGRITGAEPQTPSVKYQPVIDAIEGVKEKVGVPQSAIDAIDQVGQEFLAKITPAGEGATPQDLTPGLAQKLKTQFETAAKMKKATAYAGRPGPNPADVQAYQAVGSELGDQLKELFPDLKAAYKGYSGTKELVYQLERGLKTASNRNPVGPVSILAGMLTGAVTEKPGTAVFAGAMAELLRDRGLATRLAIQLAKATPGTAGMSPWAWGARLQAAAQVFGRAAEQLPTEATVIPADQLAQGVPSDNEPLAYPEPSSTTPEPLAPQPPPGLRSRAGSGASPKAYTPFERYMRGRKRPD